jgi:Rrf2 family iron-sulfur cluster assembly transcriptional regulator
MITAKVQYALVLLNELKNKEDGRPVKLKLVAQKHGLDLSFLEQIARSLRMHGVLRSVRGPGGGYIALRELKGMTLLEVMDAVEAAKQLKPAVSSEDGGQVCQTIHTELVKKLDEIVTL